MYDSFIYILFLSKLFFIRMYLCVHTIELLQSETETQHFCEGGWAEDVPSSSESYMETSVHTNNPKEDTNLMWPT